MTESSEAAKAIACVNAPTWVLVREGGSGTNYAYHSGWVDVSKVVCGAVGTRVSISDCTHLVEKPEKMNSKDLLCYRDATNIERAWFIPSQREELLVVKCRISELTSNLSFKMHTA